MHFQIYRNTVTQINATRKMTVSLADSTDLRVILSILYIITEVIWAEKHDSNSEYKNYVESFSNELSEYALSRFSLTSVL